MRVAVISDSHGDHAALDALLEKIGSMDAACFLGDIAWDADYLRARMAEMAGEPILYAVRGNNDLASRLPDEMVIELGGKRVYMCHGHLLSASPMKIAYRARENGAEIALFGHTHARFCESYGGVLLLNPGSAGNRCRGGRARCMVMEIEDGNVHIFDIKL